MHLAEYFPAIKREIESRTLPFPKGFYDGTQFGWPFRIDVPQATYEKRARLDSNEVKQWASKMEQLIFAQLRQPLSRIGSEENGKVYETVAKVAKWPHDMTVDFLRFVAELPNPANQILENMPEETSGMHYFRHRSTEYLVKEYFSRELRYGAVFIDRDALWICTANNPSPSVVFPAQDIHDKETAMRYILSGHDPMTCSYLDLREDGGATYIQGNHDGETHTFVELSRLFSPQFGSHRMQMWFDAPDGRPGTKKPTRVLAGALPHAVRAY